MISFAKTDIGMRRSNNEDFIFSSDSRIGEIPNLYIVADGMGGHNGGEIASSKAVSSLVEFAENAKGEITDILVEGVKYANKTVYTLGCENFELNRMGTTMDAAVVSDGKIYIAHIGDSRVYLINETIQRLTVDHSYVMDLVRAGIITMEEADNHPDKNIITRAIGIESNVECDVVISHIKEGDYVLLCSDGLSNMLSDNDIYNIVTKNALSIEDKINILIDKANQNGGMDNISVVLVRC